MKSRRRRGTAEAKLTLVLWLAMLSFVAPAAIVSGNVSNLHDGLSLISGTATGLIFAALLYLVFQKARSLSLSAKVALAASGTIACALLQTSADFGGQYLLEWIFNDSTPPKLSLRNILLTTLIYLCIYACNLAIFWILDSLEESRSQESRLARSEARAATAELERLRLQLNPHFMSNSLNTVSALLMTQRYADADQVTRKLSDFLRAAASEQEAEVPLGEELGIVDSYLEVEGARFGDRLAVEIDCSDEAVDALVPGFIIQPLVENAIKHGVTRSSETVRIAIAARREGDDVIIDVLNSCGDGAEQKAAARPGGIGLKNIRSRLEMRYGAAAALSHEAGTDAYRATIRLPFAAA
ncbi:two-component sensor histidine kinase [Sphingomonas kyeonggiensis]|uniref:Two-component sensor histidine kinase n=1 Tax=Sphingomonas kyeonggiensis TaxID=1268553 RepID=A0A7W7NT38_9SPHN|nr:histidine kinase [Sphingomonas kyeonggiensis]MBB4840875.1 two-component sensor histidine kinase [Sphingomonas kyeonggiensis]